jgi:hypothetical protein
LARERSTTRPASSALVASEAENTTETAEVCACVKPRSSQKSMACKFMPAQN